MKENITKNKATPVMKQYWEAKRNYPDAIMLFRMGDFYETFDEDAKVTSKILNIALTKRANGAASSVPLAGFPFHSLDQHLYKLLNSGYKVALCEQVEDPKISKGIVKREVVEILSPGTAVSSKFLIKDENNYLGSFFIKDNNIGYSIIDNSTGDFFCGETIINNINNIINKYQLKEIIIPEFQKDQISCIVNNNLMLTSYEDWKSDRDNCYERLLKQFKTKSLKGFGIEDNSSLIIASGACIFYLENNFFGKTNHISSITRVINNGYMKLDGFTAKNLEIFSSLNNQGYHGTLINTIDFTITPMGSRLLKKHLRQPLANQKKINHRLNLVEELINEEKLLIQLKDNLKEIFDIERIIGKISNEKANPQDLVNLSISLSKVDIINKLIRKKYKSLRSVFKNKTSITNITNLINKSISDNPPVNINKGLCIKDGVNKSLDQYRLISNNANKWFVEYQAKQRLQTGIHSLKINYNKIFGYYIDVTKPHLDKVPDYYIRKQTLANSERYFTLELKEYEEKILFSNEKCLEIEKKIFVELQEKIILSFKKIQNNAKILARLDVAVSHASLAINYNYCKPYFNSNNRLELINSRHPVVERLLPINEEFIANDLTLGSNKKHLAIITGPNMSGKSTYLRQVGLIVLLAQIGSYVPAQKCNLGIVDQLFTRVGASDNLAGGESTFLVEMNEAANILNNATNKSLIILDEIGRGTSTFDGLALAWAITEYIHNNKSIKARTLFATHYHELIFLADKLPGSFNLNIEVKEHNDEIIFLRKIKKGGASKSYGIQVAEMAGLPNQVINRSKELLIKFMSNKQNNSNNTNEVLNNDQLTLFKNENKLLKRIKKIEINKLSPLEALNILNEIKNKFS